MTDKTVSQIIEERNRRGQWLAFAIVALCVLVCAAVVYGSLFVFDKFAPQATPGIVQAAEIEPMSEPAPSPTITLTPTVNPDIAAEQAARRSAAEAQAAAEWLRVTNESGAATNDEVRKRERFYDDTQETARMRITDTIRTAEVISRTNGLLDAQATATVQAMDTAANLEIGGKVTLYFVVFIVALFGGAILTYIVITTWRQAGQPQPAENYTLPEFDPHKLTIQEGNSLQFPLPNTREYTDEELGIVAWVALSDSGLTFRALEEYGLSSERWKIIREPMLRRGLLKVKRQTAQGVEYEPSIKGLATFERIVAMMPPHQDQNAQD